MDRHDQSGSSDRIEPVGPEHRKEGRREGMLFMARIMVAVGLLLTILFVMTSLGMAPALGQSDSVDGMEPMPEGPDGAGVIDADDVEGASTPTDRPGVVDATDVRTEENDAT